MSRDRDASRHQHLGSIPRGWRWVSGRFLVLLVISAALFQPVPAWAGISTARMADTGSLLNSQPDLTRQFDATSVGVTCTTVSSLSVRVSDGDRKIVNESGTALVGDWNSIRDLCCCKDRGAFFFETRAHATLVDLNVRLQI